jgi:hypothetical protein
MSSILLRALLFLGGIFVVSSGLKSVLEPLWPFASRQAAALLALSHEQLVQNNHVRFLGGIWTGLGILLLVAPFNLKYFEQMLYLVFSLIFAGGIARLTIMRSDVLLDPIVLGSLAAELVLMPLLYLWLARTLRNRRADRP